MAVGSRLQGPQRGSGRWERPRPSARSASAASTAAGGAGRLGCRATAGAVAATLSAGAGAADAVSTGTAACPCAPCPTVVSARGGKSQPPRGGHRLRRGRCRVQGRRRGRRCLADGGLRARAVESPLVSALFTPAATQSASATPNVAVTYFARCARRATIAGDRCSAAFGSRTSTSEASPRWTVRVEEPAWSMWSTSTGGKLTSSRRISARPPRLPRARQAPPAPQPQPR